MDRISLIKNLSRDLNEYLEHQKINFDDGILKPHNQKVYKKVIAGYRKNNHVLIEQATGTGKSFVACKLLNDNAKDRKVKALFVSPSKPVKSDFEKLCSDVLGFDKQTKKHLDLDTVLYHSLHKKVNEHFDFIIFDEVHRSGANTWEQKAKEIMANNPNAKVLGMTATLDRMDKKDVCDIFDVKEPVSKIDITDAIRDIEGFAHPNYKLGKISFEEDKQWIDDAEKRTNERIKNITDKDEKKEQKEFLQKLNAAKKQIANAPSIPDIFKDTLKTNKLKSGKFIVFCPAGSDDDTKQDLSKMQDLMNNCDDWFSKISGFNGVEKSCIYSGYSDKHNEKVIKDFEESKSNKLKLLFSINMLNEGKHVKDIDGVIMLRPTQSKVIYRQQLGRACSVSGENSHPLIFDFVGNIETNYEEIKAIAKASNNTEIDTTDVDVVRGTQTHEKDQVDNFDLSIYGLDEYELLKKLKEQDDIFEEEQNLTFEKVVAWIEENKKWPSKHSNNKKERSVYWFIDYHYYQLKPKQQKQLDVLKKIYESHPAKILNMTLDEKFEYIVSWIKENERWPQSSKANNVSDEEATVYRLLLNYSSKFTLDQQKELERLKQEMKQKKLDEKFEYIVSWIKENERWPSSISTDKKERSVYNDIRKYRSEFGEDQQKELDRLKEKYPKNNAVSPTND